MPLPGNLLSLIQLAEAWEKTGFWRRACEAYEAVLRKAGQNAVPDVLRRRAVLLHLQGQSVAAEAALQESFAAAQLIGDETAAAHILNSLGGLYIELGQLEQAEQALQDAWTIASPAVHARVACNIGIVESIRGNSITAFRAYEEALGLFGSDRIGQSLVYHNLGLLRIHEGNWQASVTFFQQAMTQLTDPGLLALCQANLGWARLMGGDISGAREAALRGHTYAPAQSERVIGLCARAVGDLVTAESSLLIARLRCRSPLVAAELAYDLGSIYQETGKSDIARRYFRAALHGFQAQRSAESVKARAALAEG